MPPENTNTVLICPKTVEPTAFHVFGFANFCGVIFIFAFVFLKNFPSCQFQIVFLTMVLNLPAAK